MPENETTETPAAPEINIIDLENAVKIIDHAADQGAFRTWEVIKQVMEVRDKLSKFVEVVKPQVDKQQEEAAKAAKAAVVPQKKTKTAKRG